MSYNFFILFRGSSYGFSFKFAFNVCLIVDFLVADRTAILIWKTEKGVFCCVYRHLNGAGAATRCAAACRCIATPTDTDAAALSCC